MTKTIINSTENSFFKNLKKIYSNKTHRANSKKTILDGPHLIQAFMDSGGEVISLVTDESVISNEINLIIKKYLKKFKKDQRVPLLLYFEQLVYNSNKVSFSFWVMMCKKFFIENELIKIIKFTRRLLIYYLKH